ncbi:MAG: hypothetical protein ABI382_13330 [Nakamurella sp.]
MTSIDKRPARVRTRRLASIADTAHYASLLGQDDPAAHYRRHDSRLTVRQAVAPRGPRRHRRDALAAADGRGRARAPGLLSEN